ncbi:MAG: hypothetical protein Q8S84_01015 [bacterium]|nr:hypothetical protein [bacterium]
MNLPVLECLNIKSLPHLGHSFHTFSITFSAFAHACSKSFLRVISQKSLSIFSYFTSHKATLSKSSSTSLVNLYSIIFLKYSSKKSVTVKATSVGFMNFFSNFSIYHLSIIVEIVGA